jgi:penicillin amidase
MWTIWGPVLPPDARGRSRAFRWTAHEAERVAASVTPFESSRTLEEALDSANGLGVPAQNVVVADRDGRIGWTIYGSIPRRTGSVGALPVSWADGTHRWNGWLDEREYPRVIEPPNGRIWTANQRVVGGAMLAVVGEGNYEPGSRARAIRDQLLAKDRFTPRDFLAIQLDARATFLTRWRGLLRQTLTPEAGASKERRALRELLDRDWTGDASPESSAYRFTRAFREEVARRVMTFALSECYEADSAFDYTRLRLREGPIWALVTARPLHLLDPRYGSWQDFLLAAADAVIADALTGARGGPLANQRWSDDNVTAYRHPLSAALPFVDRWLDMPLRPVPGDLFTPRVHWGSLAASERMVVSPGREHDGIMHMPTGQSGHPMSPFYANSHDAWVEGTPTPFLPGPPIHTLTLTP